MSYNKPARATIPTPASATAELHTALVASYTNHFSTILTPELMIAHRKGCYATVINGTTNNLTLEQQLGTENAKIATEQILNGISARYSAVPQS